jgi:hypothetical protein
MSNQLLTLTSYFRVKSSHYSTIPTQREENLQHKELIIKPTKKEVNAGEK